MLYTLCVFLCLYISCHVQCLYRALLGLLFVIWWVMFFVCCTTARCQSMVLEDYVCLSLYPSSHAVAEKTRGGGTSQELIQFAFAQYDM